MNIQLINGVFSTAEATELVTQMIRVKIKFHEQKINKSSSEEDIKMREMKIRNLHTELNKVKEYLLQVKGNLSIHSDINLTD